MQQLTINCFSIVASIYEASNKLFHCFVPDHDDRDELHNDLVQHHEKVHHQLSARSYLAREHTEDDAEHNHTHHVCAVLVNQTRLHYVFALVRATDYDDFLLHVRGLNLLEACLHQILRHHVPENGKDRGSST